MRNKITSKKGERTTGKKQKNLNIQSCRHGNRHIDECNRAESPEQNPGTYGQLIYNSEAKKIQSLPILTITWLSQTQKTNWEAFPPPVIFKELCKTGSSFP